MHFSTIRRWLHPQVAARHHDAVRRLDDLVDVVEPLAVLDLRDDLDLAAVGIEDVLHGFDVPGAAHERVCDEIHVVLHGPLDKPAVFLRHRRQVDRHRRHVDALARTHGAAHDEFADQLLGGLFHDTDLQFAVGDEHPRPDGYVIHDVRHVHVDHLAGRLVAAVRAAHGDTVARPEIDAVAVLVGDRRDTDFGALRIYHDRDSRVNAVYGLDNMRSALFRDMRRIDTNHVHTGIEKVFHKLFGATEIRHCCDDLGFFHSIHTSMMLKY